MNTYSNYQKKSSDEIYLIDPQSIDYASYEDKFMGHDIRSLIEKPSTIRDRKNARNKNSSEVKVCSNPDDFMIPFALAGFKAIPDYEVDRGNSEPLLYISVKYERDYNKPEVKSSLDRLTDYLKSIGYEHKVFTEKHIRRNILLLEHLKYLKIWRAGLGWPNKELQKMVPKSSTTIGALAEKLGNIALVIEMIAKQMAYVDLTKPISKKTEIRPLKGGDYDCFY